MLMMFENAEKFMFDGVGEYGIPQVEAVYEMPEIQKWIEFAYCKRFRADRYDRSKVGVHCFEPDYKFDRLWQKPDKYAEMIMQFGCMLGPDFSMYTDFPKALQIYNHYRKHWLTAYYQMVYNITVVPTIGWVDKDSYDWCFDGEPEDSIVAVSNVGLGNRKDAKQIFRDGYNEMLTRLQPRKVLMLTRNFEDYPGPIEYIRWELHKGDQIQ